MAPIHPSLLFWVTYIRHLDVFGTSATEEQLVSELKSFRRQNLLEMLSKINLVLYNEPRDKKEVQGFLCKSFFDKGTLQKLEATIQRFVAGKDPTREFVIFHQFQVINLTKLALLHTNDDFGETISTPEEMRRLGMCCLMMNDLLTPMQDDGLPPDRQMVLQNIVRGNYFEKDERFAYGFARAHELFVQLPLNIKTHPQFYDFPGMFTARTGFTIKDYLSIGFGLRAWWADVTLSNVSSYSRTYIRPQQFFAQTRGDREKFERIFPLFSLSPDEMKDQLEQEMVSLEAPWQFRYSNLTLEKYPLIKTSAGLLCSSMRFLDWKLTRNLFYTISNCLPAEDTKSYRYFFGRVFEEYVRQLLSRMFDSRCLIEHYGASQQEAGEAVIVYPRVLVVVEAKSSRLSLVVNRSGDLAEFRKALERTVVEASKQIGRVITDFCEGRFKPQKVNTSDIGRYYPIIVTIESLPQEFFTRREIDDLVAASGAFEDKRVAPLTLVSIEELEYLEPLLRVTTLYRILGDKGDNDGYKDLSMKNYLYLIHGEFPRNEVIESRFHEITDYIENLFKLPPHETAK